MPNQDQTDPEGPQPIQIDTDMQKVAEVKPKKFTVLSCVGLTSALAIVAVLIVFLTGGFEANPEYEK